jgi:hypothetical protein
VPDRSWQDERNRSLGLAGERAVVTLEQSRLRFAGREDLAQKVRHVAAVDGDGAGYDVASFNADGSELFIEVKTTRGGAETEFFVTVNEVEFSVRHAGAFSLYRVYDFDPESGAGCYYVLHGALNTAPSLQLQPVQFRARFIEQSAITSSTTEALGRVNVVPREDWRSRLPGGDG